MMVSRWLLLFMLLLLISGALLKKTIFINETSLYPLQYYLCSDDGNLESGSVLILSHSVTHIIHNDTTSICLIVNVSDITITSDSLHSPAEIACHPYNVWPNRGLGFYIASNIRFHNIHMMYCGGILPNETMYPTKGEPFYFISNQSVSLFFSQCTNVTIERVKVSRFYGFGIIMVNPIGHTAINTSVITEPEGIEQCASHIDISCASTGLVIIWNNATINNNNSQLMETKVLLNNILFQRLYSTGQFTYKSLNKRQLHLPISKLPTGLTVIYGPGLYHAQVILKNSTIWQTFGAMFGGLVVIFYNSPYNRTQLVINTCVFHHSFHNYIDDSGVGIIFKMNNRKQFYNNNIVNMTWNSIIIKQTYFIDHLSSEELYNKIRLDSGALNIISDFDESLALTTTIHIMNTKYQSRNHAYRNPFIYAHSLHKGGKKGLEIHLNGIHASQRTMSQISSITGRLIFQNVGKVYIEGSHNVFEKQVGSAILAYNTDIHLKGTAIIRKNLANYGGAIHLKDYSYIYVYNTTRVHFENNFAAFQGGAISSEENLDIFIENIYCAFQFAQDLNLSTLATLFPLMYFKGNNALLSGNSMYISNMYKCKQKHHLSLSNRQLVGLYEHMFKFVNSNSTAIRNEVVSTPIKVCFCEKIMCQTTLKHVSVYPGVSLNLSIVAKDYNNTNAYSLIEPRLTYGRHHSHLKDESWRLNYNQMQFVSDKGCTTLNYSINFDSIKYNDLPRTLWLAVPNYLPKLSIIIKKVECPIGFIEANSSCVCNSFIRRMGISDCDIHTTSIGLPSNSWLGLIGNESLGYVSQCPTSYCISLLNSINVTELDVMCRGNRKGTLCGECIEGYSIVFGSTDCHVCTNTSLYIIAVFIVSGLVYVLLLYILRLTIDTGTINGLIFWLDILTIINDPSDVYGSIIHWMSIITHLFSFQLWTLPVCVFDEMTSLHKSSIMFSIPIYLWLLVIVIILVSKHSTLIANLTVGSSVQVLATLMHLSVSQLFIISIDTLLPSQLHSQNYSTTLVWYIDGNVSYGKNIGHVILIIISLSVLLFYIAPYIILGLFGSKMSCTYRSQYLRPFIESLHGPFKNKHNHWFGMRLLILTLMYTIFVVLRGNNFRLQLLLFTFILGLFIMFQVKLMPFKNKLINILDVWFMVLLEASFISLLYFNNEGNSYTLLRAKSIVTLLLQGTGTLTCIGVIIYHMFVRFKKTKLAKQILGYCVHSRNITNTRRLIYDDESTDIIVNSGNDDDECTRLRSPLGIDNGISRTAVGQSEVSLFKNIIIQ